MANVTTISVAILHHFPKEFVLFEPQVFVSLEQYVIALTDYMQEPTIKNVILSLDHPSGVTAPFKVRNEDTGKDEEHIHIVTHDRGSEEIILTEKLVLHGESSDALYRSLFLSNQYSENAHARALTRATNAGRAHYQGEVSMEWTPLLTANSPVEPAFEGPDVVMRTLEEQEAVTVEIDNRSPPYAEDYEDVWTTEDQPDNIFTPNWVTNNESALSPLRVVDTSRISEALSNEDEPWVYTYHVTLSSDVPLDLSEPCVRMLVDDTGGDPFPIMLEASSAPPSALTRIKRAMRILRGSNEPETAPPSA